jgi:hypothetical protein
MSFSLIPLFRVVQPEAIVNALNILVNEINANFKAIGFSYNGSVTRRQFFTALAASNVMQQVVAGIPANTNSAVYIQFISGLSVTPGDGLASNVQTTLGWTAAQMTALFTLAAKETP